MEEVENELTVVIDAAYDKFLKLTKKKKAKLTHVIDFQCHQQPPGDACAFYVCHHMYITAESTKKNLE
ncbi:hypothetical protein ACP4OV_005594 [Aristida adscensionis]